MLDEIKEANAYLEWDWGVRTLKWVVQEH